MCSLHVSFSCSKYYYYAIFVMCIVLQIRRRIKYNT